MQAELTELVQSFNEKLELNIPETITKEELLLMLEKRLGYMLEREPEGFFQAMYRIDIAEYHLSNVLQQPDALQALAKMVYNRQLDKVKSRNRYKDYFNSSEGDKELEW